MAPSSSGTRESRVVRGLRPNRSSRAALFFTVETSLTWYVSSIKYRSCSGYVFFSTPLIMICFRGKSLLCSAASRDVSVSAFRAVWPTQFPLGRRRLSRSSLPPPLQKGHRLFLQWPQRLLLLLLLLAVLPLPPARRTGIVP